MYKETFAGLDNPDCVLQDIQIEADLYETLAKVSTTHQYVNNGAVNIEAVYTFPLPSDAVLLDMNLVVGDRKLIGQIIPKKQAEDRYEDAVVDGDLPAMIQNPSHGIYTLNIANIQPGEHVAISFTYGMFLMWQGHDLRFTIPTTIASRYGDPEKAGLVDHQIPETDFLTENRYSMKIRVHGQMASAVIASPSHDINMELLDDSVLIHFAQSSALMDRDFVLNLSVSNMNKSSLMWGLDGNSHLLWACFHPHFGNQPDEGSYGLILVVDCSGSMAGDSINQARSASRNVLKTLRKQDYFNIVAFGSGHKTLFRKMKPADQDNLEEAMDFVKDLQADMGGTEMESALKNALGFICKAVLSQDILLITDGEVWDIDGAVKLASKKNHRIFSIGVGSSPAESNLKKLSTRTGGACEFVFPGESMNEKILRHAGRICSPVIQKIDMVWPSLPDQVFPGTLETLFDGDTVNVFGRFANRVESGEVGLSLIMADGQAIDVSAGDVSTAGVCKEPGLIARMAAATKLADMTDPDDATALSVKYQLICKYTHCLAIAIQAEGEKAVTLPEIRRVKQMHAAGWGAMGKVRDLAPCMVSYESRDLNYILEGGWSKPLPGFHIDPPRSELYFRR